MQQSGFHTARNIGQAILAAGGVGKHYAEENSRIVS